MMQLRVQALVLAVASLLTACGSAPPERSATPILGEAAAGGEAGAAGLAGEAGSVSAGAAGLGAAGSATGGSAGTAEAGAPGAGGVGATGGGAGAGALGGTGGDGTGGTAASVPTGCSAGSLGAGDHALSLSHGGAERAFDVHVPASYRAGQPMPLVFYFHPLLMNKEYLKGTGAPQKADAEGFIAVFAQGIESSWNAGACCGPSNGAGGKAAVDDVGFVRAMVKEVTSRLCVDEKRVYATGFSNGGFLSNRLACEASDLFAAVAPVSAVNGVETACTPSRPVPVFAINGTTDTLVPYTGGFFFPGITNGTFPSVQQTFAGWRQRNGCTDAPVVTYSNGNVSCETHAACAGGVEVTQCTVEGGGHCWYGELLCALGTNSFDIVATDATWEFLKRHRLP